MLYSGPHAAGAGNERNVHNVLAKALMKMGGMFASRVGERSTGLFLEPPHHHPRAAAGWPENFRLSHSLHLSVPTWQRLPASPWFQSACLGLSTSSELQSTVGLLRGARHLSCPQGACDPEEEIRGTDTENADVGQNQENAKKGRGKGSHHMLRVL